MRMWESMANASCCFAQRTEILFPNKPENGFHYVEYSTAEEFESYDLNREKIIGGNKTGIVFIGPLKPGKYGFFGEFNPETAQGVVIAE